MTRVRAHGERRQARTVAMQTLYEVDSTGHDPEETLQRNATGQHLSAESLVFAEELVRGTLARLDVIDTQIASAASDWPLSQMARIDKSILRLAIYEILYNNSVPAKAAINEAVELAKTFGSDASSRFVNGVLGAIYQQSTQTPTVPETPAEGEVP
ncbi:MAG TPA: transcription antitermination factor NusB [Ktedonobacterales bacterium]|jgi:N utilization substance protein B|nr:transcription antitermination factor NusB [Ktedonobacterales bacterium]